MKFGDIYETWTKIFFFNVNFRTKSLVPFLLQNVVKIYPVNNVSSYIWQFKGVPYKMAFKLTDDGPEKI